MYLTWATVCIHKTVCL